MDRAAPARVDLTKRLAHDVAVVTGGAGSIGRAVAARLAHEGAAVAIVDRDESAARQAAAALAADGLPAMGMACDVTRRGEVRSTIGEVVAKFGRLTILVNNAGISRRAAFLELTDETWNDILGVNLTGAFIAAQEAARVMVAQGCGRIVNMASVAARIAHGGQTAYAVSKAGIEAMTRAMAFELAPFGIQVNAVAPGTIATPFSIGALSEDARARRVSRIPAGRFGDAAEVAACIAFLASPDASYLSGTVVTIDGGLITGGVREQPPRGAPAPESDGPRA
jgi:NAD(P)-dependent dehydrogenase (short-subunit alcohol dehydrogenase family)